MDREKRLKVYQAYNPSTTLRVGVAPSQNLRVGNAFIPQTTAIRPPVRVTPYDTIAAFADTAADKLGGGYARQFLRTADYLLPGYDSLGTKRLADEWDRRAQLSAAAQKNQAAARTGARFGSFVKGIGDVGSLVVPAAGAERVVKGTRFIKNLDKGSKFKKVLSGIFQRGAGSLAATGAQSSIDVGQGRDPNLAKNTAIGVGVDVVASPIIGKVWRYASAGPTARLLAQTNDINLVRSVLKEGTELADNQIDEVAEAIVSERDPTKVRKLVDDVAKTTVTPTEAPRRDAPTPTREGESVIHLTAPGQNRKVFARMTPELQNFLRNETGNIGSNADDIVHLSAFTDNFADAGLREISLDDLRKSSPNLDKAIRKAESAGIPINPVAEAIQNTPPSAPVSQGTAPAPEPGVPSASADVAQAQVVEPKIPTKIQQKIEQGKKLTPEEVTKVETAVTKAETQAAQLNTDPTAAPGQQTLVDVPRPEATVARPEFQELQNPAIKETPAGNIKTIDKAGLGENLGELQDMLIAETTTGGVRGQRFGGVFKDTLRQIRTAFKNPEVARKFEEVTVDPIIRGQAALNQAINADTAALTEVLSQAGIRGATGGVSKSDREAISWVLEHFSDPRLNSKLKGRTNNPEGVKQVATFIRSWYDENHRALSAVAEEFGKKNVGKVDDYFTHIRSYKGIEGFMDSLFGRGSAPFEYVNAPSVGFRFGKTRKGNDPRYIKDALEVFEIYSRAANRFKHLTPAVEQVKLVQQTVASLEQIDQGAFEAVNQILANISDQVGPRAVQGQAGKILTRSLDSAIGRTSRGLIDGSISVAFKNLIPIQGGVTRFGPANFAKNVMKSAMEYMSQAGDEFMKIDGVEVPFLVNRGGAQGVSTGLRFKAKSALRAIPQSPDLIIAKALVRSAYDEAGERGAKAVLNAGKEAGLVIAERTPGLQAGVIADRNPLLRLASQFQTEPLNQFNFLGDIARMPKGQAAIAATKFISAGLVLNQAYNAMGLGKPVIDPVGSINDALKKFSEAEGDNPADKYKNAFGSMFADFLRVAPFGNVVGSTLGIDPAGGATRSEGTILGSTIADLTSGNPRTMFKTAARMLVPGGSQLTKTAEGAEALIRGETTNSKGETKYTVEKTPANVFKALAFGPGATSGGQQYKNAGFKTQAQRDRADETTASEDRSDVLKASFGNATVTLNGKKRRFLDLTEDQRKEAASQGSDARAIYENYKSAQTGLASNDLYPEGLSPESTETLSRLNRLTSAGKKKWVEKPGNLYLQKQAELERDVLAGKLSDEQRVKRELSLLNFRIAADKKLKGSDMDEYFATPLGKYELKSAQVDYRKNNDPEYTELDYYKDQEGLARLSVLKNFSKDATDIYTMSEKNIRAYLSSHKITDKLWNELRKLDAAYIAAGYDKNGKLGGEGRNGGGGSGRGSSRERRAYLASLLGPESQFRFAAPERISSRPRNVSFRVRPPATPRKPRIRIKL